MKNYDRKVYIIPDINRIKESMELGLEYGAGFEYNDFFSPKVLRDERETDKLITFYKGLSRDLSGDTMHGAFFDVLLHSDDEDIKRISQKRVIDSMEIAKNLGLRGVVFHTNITPNFTEDFYVKNWAQTTFDFWMETLYKYPNQQVYIENMFDMSPDAMLLLAEKMDSMDESLQKQFGFCLDYAHMNVFAQNEDKWFLLAPHILHMHINDNDLKKDCHDAVGSGLIDWQLFTKRMEENEINATVLVETRDIEKQRDSLKYMKKNGVYPFV